MKTKRFKLRIRMSRRDSLERQFLQLPGAWQAPSPNSPHSVLWSRPARPIPCASLQRSAAMKETWWLGKEQIGTDWNRLEQIGTDWIGSRASRIKMQISRNQDESGWIKQQNTGSSHWLNVFVEVGDTNCYSMIHLFSYVSVVWFCHSFSTCSIGRAVMRVAGVLRPNNLCLDWDLQWKLLERSRSSAEEAAGDLWRGRERDRGARWDGEGIRNYITDAHFGQNKIW